MEPVYSSPEPDKVLLAALYCPESQGRTVFNCNSWSWRMSWWEWRAAIQRYGLPNSKIWVCRRTRHLFGEMEGAQEWIHCPCWEKSLFKEPAKCVAATFCLTDGGVLFYDDETKRYLNSTRWYEWLMVARHVNKFWMCQKAVEEYGRPESHMQIRNNCKCWEEALKE